MADGLDATTTAGGVGQVVLAAGAPLGKYRLERVLGEGGMGIVWTARDPDLDREVAIKLLRSEHAPASLRTRLLREARAMARLKHPNVLTVHEVASDGDRDYIVMELVDGTSLDAWLARRPPLREVWQALDAAGRGLAAAHAAGLVHRDFKPHNVLRSHAGRVMVTDFGLARGLGDDAAATGEPAVPAGDIALDATLTPETPSGRRADALLDQPLTQTGALIGTPAYMAPEQYTGAAPDPRTDQFAFCVTAWQAFAGERPFKGTTLDELRRAAAGGVTVVDARLPRGVRAVLARGLDPDPAKRWPDVPALLDALERARTAPTRRRRIGIAAFALALAGVLGIRLATRGTTAPAAAASPCEPVEHAFDRAWSPAASQQSPSKLVAMVLDRARDRWLATYQQVCAKPSAPAFNQRIGCLLGVRDEIAETVPVIQALAKQYGEFDVFSLISPIEPCAGAMPPTPPQMPDDPALRARIREVRMHALDVFSAPPEAFAERAKAYEAEARAVGWPPLVAETLYGLGVVAHKEGNYDVANELQQRAIVEAIASRYTSIEAKARLDRVELVFDVAQTPRDPDELTRATTEARAAIAAAGNDSQAAAILDSFAARQAVYQHHPERALAGADEMRHTAIAAGDMRHAVMIAEWQVTAFLARDQAGDAEAAAAVVRDTQPHVDRAMWPRMAADLVRLAGDIAWRRGDLDEVHRLADTMTARPASGPAIEGRVVGPDGEPVEGAVVVAWQGELDSDSKRLYRERWLVSGDSAVTDRDGRFTLHANATAIVAEHGDLRSRPQPVAPGATLQLAATRTVTGSVTSIDRPASGLDAFARIELAGASFVELVPVARDGTFTLARVPEGAVVGVRQYSHIVLAPASGPITWPVVAPLDVIVGGGEHPFVFVLREKQAPRTRDELDALAMKAADIASAEALEIGGGDETEAGRALYEPHDRHVVLDGIGDGDVTVCAADGPHVACVPYAVHVTGLVETTFADGTVRHWANANAVRLKL